MFREGFMAEFKIQPFVLWSNLHYNLTWTQIHPQANQLSAFQPYVYSQDFCIVATTKT